MKYSLEIAFLLAVVPVAVWPVMVSAQNDEPLSKRIFRYDEPLKQAFGQCFDNPALAGYRHTVSLTGIAAAYHFGKENEAIDPQRGSGHRTWNGTAGTYLKLSGTTLWGEASYSNRKRTDVVWNESSDLDLIYPYVTADTVGGDIKGEVYTIRGGYAGSRSDWNWGAELAYDATLEYRDVDPRPKNVSGMLRAKVGAAYVISNTETLGISLGFDKYKQTNDIMFMSETGKTCVFLMTGMGNHYNRFAGASETSYYSGERYSVSIDMVPAKRSGAAASVRWSRFGFSKQLVDLNRLPLCHASENVLSAQAGWLAEDWSVCAKFSAARRHGAENLFGDAVSGVYPAIGELTMYADNRYDVSASGTIRIRPASNRHLYFNGDVGFRHRQEVYVDPQTEAKTDNLYGKIRSEYRAMFAKGWNLTASAEGEICRFDNRYAACAGRIGFSKAIGKRCAAGGSLFWRGSFHDDGNRTRTFNATIRLLF